MLSKKMREMSRPIWLHLALKRVTGGQISLAQMQDFVLQRHALAEGFVDLLQAIIQNTDDPGLKECVHKNFQDETGAGVYTDSHALWRVDYLNALGLVAPFNAQPLSGTNYYNAVLSGITSSGDPLLCAGAVLLLERSIPGEFARILRGLEQVSPENFRLDPADDTDALAWKGRARLYLWDHIQHDASAHYPDLVRELTRISQNDGHAFATILQGAELVATAKVKFYDSIAEHFGI